MSRYTIIKNGKAENFAEASADFAASQNWVLSGDEAAGDLWDGGTFIKPPPLPPVVPQSVTMRQARLALLAAGKLAAVNSAIAAMASPQKEAAQIEWEYSQTVERDRPFVLTLGAALGLDDAQLDALFVAAAAL